MHGKGLPREPSLLFVRSFGGRILSNVTMRSLSTMWSLLSTRSRLCPRSGDWRWIAMISMSLWKSASIETELEELTTEGLWSCIMFHSKKLWRRVCQRR
ncbi:hypothetical protein AVEN_273879-1 [Araneus ventricosus]|uniref:Uncharacterized protein n=1 Tax=Araneus ventricosus TaxID=182803 RepID=A0A4Y2GS76_ARAVE|nr:hypothetical protein AVEN_273879-1 [Araneus ventricosus]